MNYGLDLYLTSEHKEEIQFCLLLQSAHLGRAGPRWSSAS